MRKRVLFVLIALFAIGQYSFAFDFAAVAPSGQTLYYSYTNGVNGNSVYVTYPGIDLSHNYDGYTRPAGALTIPSIVSNGSKDYTVTSIGGYAFRDVECYAFDACIGLTSVTIPNSVTSIGDCAFGECLGLTSVTIPNSVTSIGAQAFNRVRHIEYYGTAHIEYLGTTGYPWGAYSMNGVTVGDFIYADASKATLLAYIGNSAEVTIPSTVTSINEGAFQYCSSLTSVTIGNSVTSIGYDAFRNCSGLASVTIGNSVTSIGYRAFWACRGLTSVTIGNSVASIGHSAFYGCSSLTSVTIPNSVTSMDDRVFYGCSGLTTVTISNSLTRISWESFSGCTGLTSVTIPNSVTGIGPQAFYGCSGLTSVTIPNSVTTIEDYAFYRCIGLASLAIPSSVTAISGYAFYEVRHIEYYGTATGEPWGAYSMNGVTEGDFVYADASRTTLLAYIGNSAEVNIPSTVTLIDVGAFSGCSSLTSVTIGNSVTRIGNYAFKNCSGLTSVTIGNSLANVGREAFSGCSGLTSIVVESGNTHYDSRENCNAIIQTNNNLLVCGCQNTIIPNSVTSIGGYAFQGCSGLTSVTIPNSVTSIGADAFSGCSGLTSVTIPNSVTSIGANAFSGCSSLTSVTIPNSVTGIGIYAFSGCTGLTSIECQATVPPTIYATTFEDVPTGIPVHIPCVTLADYQAAAGWSSFTNYIEGNVFPFSVTANTADNTMGTAAVTTAPNCTNNTATITATANCGYQFVHWSNGSTDNPYTLTITQDTSLTAVFEAAEKIALSCPSGQTLYYKINCANLTATVVPENDSYPYYSSEPSGELTIPSSITVDGHTYPVTSIGRSAFEGCLGITSVTIPTSVTNLDQAAFESTGLQSLTIPNSVTSIGFSAFRDCTGLTSITIPASVTNIDGNIFIYCSQLTTITVDAGNSVYDSRNSCNAIIETATNKLIVGCNTTTIPNTVVSIGSHAFSMFRDFPTIFIPNSVTSIGENAFYCCFNITTIEVDANNTTFDSRENCNAIIETSTNKLILGCINTVIPNTVTIIGSSAFEGCGNLSSITIPSSVTSIEDQAFRGCDLLEVVSLATVPPTLSFLVFYNAFHDAYSTISLYIPCGSLADYQAADGWSDFTNIQEQFPYTLTANTANHLMGTAAVTTEPTCSDNTATITATPNCGYSFVRWSNAAGTTVSTDNPCTLTVTQDTTLTAEFEALPAVDYAESPSGHILYYRIINGNAQVTWQTSSNPRYTDLNGDLVIPDSITLNCVKYKVASIRDSAFFHCLGLTSVVIPNTVSSIGNNAFEGCRNMASVTIPNLVTRINSRTFCECGLTSVTIPNSVTDIGRSAFHACGQLASVTIPNSVTNIAMEAFRQTGLTSVTIPNSVRTIGAAAFAESRRLESVTLSDSVRILEYWVFMGCSSLSSITIPDSVTSIDIHTFSWCKNLTSIEVGSGNRVYDSRENCNAIIVTASNTLFLGCMNTVMPNTVTSIGNEAFDGCNRLTSITIPNAITSIGNNVFRSCTGLTEIITQATIPPTLGDDVFANVPTDIPVYIPCGSLADYQAADGWSDFTNIQEQFPYTLTANTADNTMGTAAVTTEPSCANNTATITATANSGHRFDHWNDGVIINPRSVTVTSDTAFTAIFEYAGTHEGSSQPTPAVSCGEYLWPAVPSPNAEVQIKQKHDHTSAYASQGWDTLVSANSPTIELSCMPYIPVQFFNGQYTVDLIPYNPPDTTFRAGTQVPLSSSDDRFSNPAITLSFPFYFFGERKNGFVVGSNGMMSFNTAAAGQYCAYYYSAPLPWPDGTSGAPNQVSYMRDAIYGVYEDTYPNPSQISGGDGIYYGVQDIYPGRKIICSWNNIPLYSCTNYRSSYQIVCYEGTNIIEVHVKQRQACPSFNGGHGIIGIQNATGQSQVQGPSNSSTHYVVTGSPAAFYPAGKNIFTTNLTETAYRFTPQGTTSYNYAWYRVYDDGRASVELTTDPSDPNGYYIPMDDGSSCPTLTRAVVNPTEPAKYVFELRFQDANNDTYILYDTCTVGYLSANTVTLTATSANETMGTVDGGGIYSAGFSATITATANSGYRFDHWSDGNTDNPRTITVTSDTTISAIFAQAGSSCDTISNQTNVSINNNICQVTCCTGQTILCSIDNERHTATVTGYTECEGEMKIPEAFMVENTMYTITAIGPRAFYACSGLTAVHLPITVVTYGEKAFAECPLLGTMTYKVRAAQQ